MILVSDSLLRRDCFRQRPTKRSEHLLWLRSTSLNTRTPLIAEKTSAQSSS